LIAPGERIKLGLLSLLLLLMLGVVCIAAVGTYQAVRNFQQQNNQLKTGDVSTIRGWMTIHVVAHIYHVPEDYLAQTLAVSSPEQVRHFTLNQLASTRRQPVNRLIQTLQRAILDYRKTHQTGTRTPVLYQKLSQQRIVNKPRSVKPVSAPISQSDTRSHVLTAGRT
jgi:hypothetical protein